MEDSNDHLKYQNEREIALEKIRLTKEYISDLTYASKRCDSEYLRAVVEVSFFVLCSVHY